MEPATWTFVILGVAVVAFVSGRVPLAVVSLGVALALWATGVLTLNQALAGFGDPTVLFIASLFVVSESLDATGVTAWLGQQVVTRAGRGRVRLTVVIGAMAAVLAAFISINGAVAALLPVVVVVAVRAGIVPSKLLIPLAFAASGEVAPRGVHKGAAIGAILERLDIDPADAIGVGDNWNDAEMFEVCGTAIAMGNAVDGVKALADQVTTSIDDDGIWNAFERNRLI